MYSPTTSRTIDAALRKNNSQTLRNYANLKKAGYDMKKHRIATFLIPSSDNDSSDVEIDEKDEVTLNFK